MSRVFSISETLGQSGGGDETYTSDPYTIDSAKGAIQVENQDSENSTNVDFHLEARLSDSLSWQGWISPYTGVGNGEGNLDTVDMGIVEEIRVRIENQDSLNSADVAVEVETWD